MYGIVGVMAATLYLVAAATEEEIQTLQSSANNGSQGMC